MSDRKPGTIQYRCRLCGETFDGPHSPCVNTTIMEVVAYERSRSFGSNVVTLYNMHHGCRLGLGVADIAGANYDSEAVRDA